MIDLINNKHEEILNLILGGLYGLVIGDALGFPIKTETLNSIKKKYGEQGITDFVKYDIYKKGSYSSESQLTLSTINGIIYAYDYTNRILKKEDILKKSIYLMYKDWLKTQGDLYNKRNTNEIIMLAINNKKIGSINNPINDSKSASTIIKTIPFGFILDEYQSFRLGMEITSFTHGNSISILSGGFLACLISCIRQYKDKGLEYCIRTALSLLKKTKYSQSLSNKIEYVLNMDTKYLSPEQVTFLLGEGWDIEEAIAYSLYCSINNKDNYRQAVYSAINHTGNSDTIGAITGCIIGTYLGYNEIPQEWIINIENSEFIELYSKKLLEIYKFFDTYKIIIN